MTILIYPQNPNRKAIEKVVEVLNEGGLIIIPTDTLYAIACDATKSKAVERVCEIKKMNPAKHLLSILCADLSHLSQYARVSNFYFKLLKKNLPGPFTFILPSTNELPKIYKSKKTIGIRVPDHPITLSIIEAFGKPLLSTSLPLYNTEIEYITDPELIEEKFTSVVDLIVSSGYGQTEPSTIVDCTEEAPAIIRQGKGELLL